MDLMDKIISLCKRRGFVYPGSEIYGGLANTWDYGPLGVELKNNIKKQWWKNFVQKRAEIYGLDGGILLNPRIWEASGHVQGFIDILVECLKCHKRYRLDHLKGAKKCPECGGSLSEPRRFVPMFKTFIGPVEDTASVAFLRPETAQAIFVNFKNIIDSFHPRLPFGIAQTGKAFRNEITLGNFIFRSLEFEQMEIEYFIREENWESHFEEWKKTMEDWVIDLGVKKENLSWRRHADDELSHYSKRTEDLEFNFPFGVRELYGLAYRTDFDLKNHAKFSGQELSYQDPETKETYIPHVIEPSMGVERTFLAVLLDAYEEESGEKGIRTVLKLNPKIAPFKVAVFPLVANKEELVAKAREIYETLMVEFPVAFDDRGNIGKRYFSQDEIGTPWCVTVDYQTLEDNTVTVRDRDTTKQERVAVDKLLERFLNYLK
ncbi:glycine--tRNA ligase [Candidatus Microgenomates bacterium]|jgi:glycyl-tRNA synthetase|nr:MAG: glycine--tRNA ligase [Candidatus Microgenomates bacterium]